MFNVSIEENYIRRIFRTKKLEATRTDHQIRQRTIERNTSDEEDGWKAGAFEQLGETKDWKRAANR